MGIKIILWREWTFFKHRFMKITTSQIISPLLYLITFGVGLGNSIQFGNQPYIFFLIPGLLAMTTMRNSYSSVAMRISISRLHEKSFETYIYSPMRMSHLALGYILSGAFRGLYAGFFVIIMALIARVDINFSISLFIIIFINALIFSSIGFFAAMTIDTHYDLNRFTKMVITPMSFLCGAFYSVESLPKFFKIIIEFFPLTHTTRLIRELFFGQTFNMNSFIISIIFTIFLIFLSIKICYKEIK